VALHGLKDSHSSVISVLSVMSLYCISLYYSNCAILDFEISVSMGMSVRGAAGQNRLPLTDSAVPVTQR